MQIFCRVCNQAFQSQSPNAPREVLEAMTQHLAAHANEAQVLGRSVATALQLLSTYMLVKHFVTVPAEEKQLRDLMKQNEDTLRSILGAQPISIVTTKAKVQ